MSGGSQALEVVYLYCLGAYDRWKYCICNVWRLSSAGSTVFVLSGGNFLKLAKAALQKSNVFVVPEEPVALKVLFLSREQLGYHWWGTPPHRARFTHFGAQTISFVERNEFRPRWPQCLKNR